jgi:rod shape determining protein RodA
MNDRPVYWPLLLNAFALTAVGLLCLWSIMPFDALDGGRIMRVHFAKQVIFFGASMVALTVILLVNPKHYRNLCLLAFIVAIILLLGLRVAGTSINGARRWYRLGSISIQPSEFMKIAMVLVLARFLENRKALQSFWGFCVPFLIAAVPLGIIVLQPDLGTTLLFGPVVLAMLFVAGAKAKHLWAVVICVIILIPIGFSMLKPYQLKRVIAFLDPANAPPDTVLQLNRSQTAIARGGLTGVEIGESGYWAMVPEKHTDFIFAVIGEEWGFLGTSLVIFLYVTFFILAIRMALQCATPFGRLVVVGLTTFIAVQVAINIGMTIGLAPITGLTLPFISYGGSSLLMMYCSLGIMLAVGRSQRREFGGDHYSQMAGEITELGQRPLW